MFTPFFKDREVLHTCSIYMPLPRPWRKVFIYIFIPSGIWVFLRPNNPNPETKTSNISDEKNNNMISSVKGSAGVHTACMCAKRQNLSLTLWTSDLGDSPWISLYTTVIVILHCSAIPYRPFNYCSYVALYIPFAITCCTLRHECYY